MTSFHLAYLSLVRKKVPSLIAVSSIALAVAISGTLLRLYLLSESRFSSLAKGPEAIVGAKAGGIDILLGALNFEGGFPDFIPYKLYSSLKSGNAVRFEDGAAVSPQFAKMVVPLVFFGRYKKYRVVGTSDQFLNQPGATPPVSLAEGRWASNPGEVVVGHLVAQQQNLKLGDTLAISEWVSEGSESRHTEGMQVVGRLAPLGSAWDQAVYSNIEQAWQIIRGSEYMARSIWNEHVLHYFLVYLEPGGFAPMQSLINKRSVAQAILVKDEQQRLEGFAGTGQNLGLLICAMTVLLGSLGVSAMMVTRFDAMASQIAVLRALGYLRSEIRNWLFWEGALLGVTACVIGGCLDGIAFPVIRSLLGSLFPSSDIVHIGLWHSAVIWIMTIAGTVIAVFIPLYRLYKQDVHQSLRA